MGWRELDDCDLGFVLTHGGGFPGYGSNVVLLPDRGTGVFILTNRTYAEAQVPAMAAALAIGATAAARPVAVSPGVAAGYEIAKQVWTKGTITGASLSSNVLQDRDAAHRQQDLAELRAKVGDCAATSPVIATSAMAASFAWNCERGRITGTFLLAPTNDLRLQSLTFALAKP